MTSFEELFFESSCAADLRDMDTRNITTLRRLFYRSDGTGPNCANWDVGRVADVFQAFADSQMNSPFSLGNWESLTSMEQMFVQTQGDYYGRRDGRVLFNQPIADWDVSRITSMRLMFGCTAGANVGGIGAAFNQRSMAGTCAPCSPSRASWVIWVIPASSRTPTPSINR